MHERILSGQNVFVEQQSNMRWLSIFNKSKW